MIIKDTYGDIKIATRRKSPSDKVVIKEIFDENVYQLRDDMLTDGGVVLDVGANIGAFTLEILRRAKHTGRRMTVIAVEAEPHNLSEFKKNLAANRHLMESCKVILVACAVSDKDSTSYITNEHGGSRLADEGQPVDTVTLDQIFAAYDITEVDIAKFDIEGSEIPTIMAASDETIDKIHFGMIEFDDHNGLDKFSDLVNRFARKSSIQTLGVPARGCYVFTERHIK